MRFEHDDASFEAERVDLKASTDERAALPSEIAFLRHGQVDRKVLAAVAQAARRAGLCAASVLIADGHVSASRYYRALAHHLDLNFIDGWPEIAETDVASAHARGSVMLVEAEPPRRLVAPLGEDLHFLLSEECTGAWRSGLAITTPAHLAAIIHFRSQHAIERLARDALPDKHPHLSARGVLDAKSLRLAAFAAALLFAAMVTAPRVVGSLVGLAFFFGIIFRLLVAADGFEAPVEQPRRLGDAELPVYTVLVPLSDEGDILPELLAALEAIDYPRAKLEVLVLIEPEDVGTRQALARTRLPPWLHVVFGPWGGGLRTKPRALNIGLLMARGTLLTVFDAEDRPDPDQLQIAAAMFAQAPRSLACLQGRLAIENGAHSLLARMFALEYAFLFDVFNVGIGHWRLPMALGGTSNHFRTAALREAGGWDAWNVTEDADLGLRLARMGFDVACLPSTTLEIAPEQIGAWMKQRRRWLKGWMQTFLVLARDAPRLFGQLGCIRSCALLLLLVNLVASPLLFPFFSAYVAYRFVRDGIPSPSGVVEVIEATIWTAVVLIGTASTLWCGYAGARVRKLGAFLPSVPLMLPYQLMISAAAWLGFAELIVRPYHWHKTAHAARRGDAERPS